MPPDSQQPQKGSGACPQAGIWVWLLAMAPSEGRWVATTPTSDKWYRKRYRKAVAMNLRLPEVLARALRELSEQTGRSQQELTREALEEYVRDYRLRAYPTDVRHLITPAPAGYWADVVVLDPPLPPGIDVARLLEEQRQERS